MKLEEIIKYMDGKIPENMALDSDNVGLMDEYDLNLEINSVKIFMDLIPQYDNFNENTLIITHHPPLFKPKTPTYTIHSNWDIICGGANDALADFLKLDVVDYLDDKTKIGRICKSKFTFKEITEIILNKFENVKVVNRLKDEKEIKKVGIISGFGLKNPKFIEIAKNKDLDLLISGDLSQETAILAKNLEMTLIDIGHHESEVPGLYYLQNILKELDVDIEVIDIKPIEKLG